MGALGFNRIPPSRASLHFANSLSGTEFLKLSVQWLAVFANLFCGKAENNHIYFSSDVVVIFLNDMRKTASTDSRNTAKVRVKKFFTKGSPNFKTTIQETD